MHVADNLFEGNQHSCYFASAKRNGSTFLEYDETTEAVAKNDDFGTPWSASEDPLTSTPGVGSTEPDLEPNMAATTAKQSSVSFSVLCGFSTFVLTRIMKL